MSNERIERVIKSLKRIQIEEIIHWSTHYSLINLNYYNTVQVNENINVFPWNLDSLLLLKVYMGSAIGGYNTLNDYKFQKLILSLSNYDYQPDMLSRDLDILDIVPIITANQFNYQIDNRILIHRAAFFYKECDSTLLKDIFYEKYGLDAYKALQIFFGLYGLSVAIKDNPIQLFETIKRISIDSEIQKYLDVFTIELKELESTLHNRHDNPVELVHVNYYLKQYCFINISGKRYLTYPHNLISAITYGTIYKLTEGNEISRERLGKEVLEEYIYHLCYLNSKFQNITSEISYTISGNILQSADVIAVLNEKCLFIESKSSVVNSRFRNPCSNGSQEHYISLYSNNLYQLYKGILNHLNNHYQVFDSTYNIADCYGLVVNLEDTNISRLKVFSKLIEIIETKRRSSLSEEEKNWIFEHLRIIDLYEFERIILSNTNSPIMKFFMNSYTDLVYMLDESESGINEAVTKVASELLKEFQQTLIDVY